MMKYESITYGPLPVDTINRLLDSELDPGNAYLSSLAHMHIALDHSEDYPIVIQHLESIIERPAYVGQDPKHGDNFVLFGNSPLLIKRKILVAIKLIPNKFGNYNIASSYLENEQKLQDRRQNGHVKIFI